MEGERGRTADLGGGSEVCEGDGSVTGEGRKRGGACERGGEEAEDAGACIAACTFLASRCRVADACVDPWTSWSPRCESISLGVFVSVNL